MTDRRKGVMKVPISYPLAVAFVAAVLQAGGGQTASGQSPYAYAWCARYLTRMDNRLIRGLGQQDARATNCYFASYRECEATVSAVGGYCYRSRYFGPDYKSRRLRQ
jgi:hypothetical protein